MLVCLLPLDFCIVVALLINQILLKLYTPFFPPCGWTVRKRCLCDFVGGNPCRALGIYRSQPTAGALDIAKVVMMAANEAVLSKL